MDDRFLRIASALHAAKNHAVPGEIDVHLYGTERYPDDTGTSNMGSGTGAFVTVA